MTCLLTTATAETATRMKYNEAKQIYKDFVLHKISTSELWDMLDEYFEERN